MSELLTILGSLGSFGAAIWIWRFAKIAILFKLAALSIGSAIGLSILGVLSIEAHPERVIEIVRILFDVVPI